MLCAGCRQTITEAQYLKCSLCTEHYDLTCANVSETWFCDALSNDHRSSWKCQACRNKMPKVSNVNEPIRPPSNCASNYPSTDADETNITLRRRHNTQTQQLCESEYDLSVDDIEGNTLLNSTKDCNLSLATRPTDLDNRPITLEQISTLLDSKLENMRNSIIMDIKSTLQETIQLEIKSALKKVQEDVEHQSCRSHVLEKSQNSLKEQVVIIDKTIEKIEEQLNNLANTKKIVLYGLLEDHHETENSLYDRVSQAFQEIMNININPYIEDIKRIGKKGYKRPLEIELISKRMTKYILENARGFNNTGLAVGMYLDGTRLQERNELRKHLTLARKNGDHAVIKNNRLFINGKESIASPKAQPAQTTAAKKIEDQSLTNKADAPSPLVATPRPPRSPMRKEINHTFR